MKHVVMWSGGITSWATARIVVERHGPEAVTFLFADTNTEDEDLHRFNEEAAAMLGGQVVRVADPQERDTWDVFDDERYIGNTRLAPCAKLLKQAPARRWVAANTAPKDSILYIGMDWMEPHRIPGNRAHWEPWRVEYPLTEPPLYDKDHWMEEARRAGLTPPRLYELGFAHNNCGGGCVKGGQGQWALVLKVFPERYAYHEERERQWRAKTGKNVTILRDRRGGTTKPLTLEALRLRIEAEEAVDMDDIGGCGCFTEAA